MFEFDFPIRELHAYFNSRMNPLIEKKILSQYEQNYQTISNDSNKSTNYLTNLHRSQKIEKEKPAAPFFSLRQNHTRTSGKNLELTCDEAPNFP